MRSRDVEISRPSLRANDLPGQVDVMPARMRALVVIALTWMIASPSGGDLTEAAAQGRPAPRAPVARPPAPQVSRPPAPSSPVAGQKPAKSVRPIGPVKVQPPTTAGKATPPPPSGKSISIQPQPRPKGSPAGAGGGKPPTGGPAAANDNRQYIFKSEKPSGNARKSPIFVPPKHPPQRPPRSYEMPRDHTVRVSGPSESYPKGHWVQYDKAGNPVDPSTGQAPRAKGPEARALTHVPLP